MSVTRLARVGVTGATGQVGAAILRHLHDEGWRVVAAARNAVGAALVHASLPACDIRVGPLSADGRGPHLLDDCDVVVNCALASAGGDPRQAYTVNRRLVDGLLQARSLRRLVHFSTVAVYGEMIRPGRDAARMFRFPWPDSEYGRLKLDGERYVARRCRARGVRSTRLRLGHVYGAGIARSREIIGFLSDPAFSLPYAGRLPSNAIHVDRLAAAIAGLLERDGPDGVYDLAERDSTWRDVFDWHAASLDLPRPAPMPDEESDRARALYAGRSVAREVSAWVRSLPVRRLVRSPGLFDMGLRVLATLPGAVTRRVADLNRSWGARSGLAGLNGNGAPLPPIYLSEGLPGPHLELAPIPAAGPGSPADRRRHLREWHSLWDTPAILRAAGGRP